MSWLEATFLGNPVSAWLVAAGALLLVLLALAVARRVLAGRLRALSERTATGLDDLVIELLRRTSRLLLLALAVSVATRFLALPERAGTVIDRVTVLLVLFQGGVWAAATLTFFLRRYRERELSQDPGAVTTMSALGFAGKLVVWLIVLLLALDNLGVDVTALVAGLGVGGIAVALAVQNILGDLFASLSIVLDKPFVIGDFLNVDGFLGKVEQIGLKTTRLRSLSGEQLIFSNSDLLGSRVRNYGRMFERRVLFTVGVTYDTPPDVVEEIPGMIREIVESKEQVRFDRSHFVSYGDSALNVETVYYVLSPEYNVYMDIHQTINLEVLRRFAERGIEFAFPTRTVHLHAATGGGDGEAGREAGGDGEASAVVGGEAAPAGE